MSKPELHYKFNLFGAILFALAFIALSFAGLYFAGVELAMFAASPISGSILTVGLVATFFLGLNYFFPLPSKKDEQLEKLAALMNRILTPQNNRDSELVAYFKAEHKIVSESIAELSAKFAELKKLHEQISDSTKTGGDNLKNSIASLSDFSKVFIPEIANLQNLLAEFANQAELSKTKVSDINAILGEDHDLVHKIYDISNQMSAKNTALLNTLSSVQNRIVEGVENTDKRSSKMLENISETLRSLTSTSAALAGTIEDITREVDNKINSIKSLFDKQHLSLEKSSKLLDEQSDKVNSALTKQADTLEKNTQNIISRIDVAQTNLENNAQSIIKTTGEAVTSIREVSTTFAEQSQNIEQLVKSSLSSISTLNDDLLTRINDLGKNISQVNEEAGRSTKIVEDSSNYIIGISEKLKEEVTGIEDIFKTQLKTMEEHFHLSDSQSRNLRNSLKLQTEELADVINVVSTQSRLSEASLAGQSKILGEASENLLAKVKTFNDAISNASNNLYNMLNKSNIDLDSIAEKIAGKGELAKNMAQEVISKTFEAMQAFEGSSNILADNTTKTVEEIFVAASEIKNREVELSTVLNNINLATDSLREKLLASSRDIPDIAEQADSIILQFSQTLKEKGREFEGVADKVERRTQAIIDGLAEIGKSFENISLNSAQNIEVSATRSQKALLEVSSTYESISNNINETSEEFNRTSQNFAKLVENAKIRLQDIILLLQTSASDLNSAGEKTENYSKRITQSFNNQIQNLLNASEKASEQYERISKVNTESSLDGFLKDGAKLVEKLQSISVDIAHIFSPEAEEELWKRYYEGDTSIFSRYLSKALSKQSFSQIRSMFETNPEFRELVTSYVGEFERLLAKAYANEKADILVSLFTSTDLGKIYMVISKALGKIN